MRATGGQYWLRAAGGAVIGRGGRLTLVGALLLSLTPVALTTESIGASALVDGTGPFSGAIFEAGDDPDYEYVNDVLATLTEA